MSFFKNIWSHIESVFSGGAKSLEDFLRPFVEQVKAIGEGALISAAEKAVIAAELQGGTGADKLKAAKQAVMAELGTKVAQSLINSAIELAVVKLNSMKIDTNPLATPPVNAA